jgi:hypothetical protein
LETYFGREVVAVEEGRVRAETLKRPEATRARVMGRPMLPEAPMTVMFLRGADMMGFVCAGSVCSFVVNYVFA